MRAPAGADFDQRIDAATPASDAAAARMEHDVAIAVALVQTGECALRLMDGKARCAQSTLLVAVGIAEQHTLATVVGLEWRR